MSQWLNESPSENLIWEKENKGGWQNIRIAKLTMYPPLKMGNAR
jgi:hypothetical protein